MQMTTSNIVAFYTAIRKDPALIAHLGEAETEETLIERIKEEASKRGLALGDADIRQGFDHFDSVVHQAAGDGELTEKELEIVSGGIFFQTLVEHGVQETKGQKWGSYETNSDGSVHYYNSAGCMTDKNTFLKMNA
jgi:hypothetical protein